MNSHTRRRRREDFQIALICALPLEYDAVVFACDEIWEEDRAQLGSAPGDYNTYSTGRMGSHDVVLLLLPNMGKSSAASAAASLRSSFTGIKLAILTGICGGVPGIGTSNEVFLGDVVISKSIMQYDLGRKYPNRFAPKDTVEDSLGRPNKEIRSLVATFMTLHGRSVLQRRASHVLGQIQQRATDEGHQNLYRRPPAAEDRLFKPGCLHRHYDSPDCGCSESDACEIALTTSCEVLQCDYSCLVPRSHLETVTSREQTQDGTVTREIRVVVGRVGSGDTVVKAGLDRDRIAKQHDLIAFEMEGAGVWEEIPCIIVKAVCDYADSHKNKKWQHFAAATAASTTKALLEHYAHMDSPPAPHTWFLVPYNENPDFVGRSDVLNQIKRLFGDEQQLGQSQKLRSRVAIYGLGGIGKTQIALAYALWLQHERPDVSVFWVHASNAERFRQAYSSIAQECHIPGYDDPKADILMLVKTWLEKTVRGRLLMVIDNADNTQLFFPPSSQGDSIDTHSTAETRGGLARYIPECVHGSILITTRNKQTASRLVRGNSLLEIGGMNESEASELLRSILNDEVSTEEASNLSIRLEHLPLALTQAAAFMQENSISISKYIRLLDESDESLVDQLSEPFEAIGRDSETPHALTATWIVSFNQIQQQEALASDVLSFCSLLDRQGIPEQLIVSFCDQRNEKGRQISTGKIIKALGTLKAFSFVSEAKNNSIDMHRLVQLVTRKWLEIQGGLAGYAEQALRIVSDLYPYGRHESRQVCQDYLPHANAVLQNQGTGSGDERLARASLLLDMTGYFIYRGQWTQAEQGADQSLRLRKEILGDEHPSTLTSMANLAATYRNQGRWKEAEELEVRVMETRKRVLGDEHPDTLGSMANLASTYWNQGRWKEAEELEVRVMETRKRVLGDEHPDTLGSMANLAHTWNRQERQVDAIQLMRDCLRLLQRCLGVDHPYTRSSLSDLEEWESNLTQDKGQAVAVKKRFSFKVPIRNKRVIFKRDFYR